MDMGTGFSLLSTDIPSQGNDEIHLPDTAKLAEKFPNQADLIRHLAAH